MALRLLQIDDMPAWSAIAAFRSMLTHPDHTRDCQAAVPTMRRFLALVPVLPSDELSLSLEEAEWYLLADAAHEAILKVRRGDRRETDNLWDFITQVNDGIERERRLDVQGARRPRR